jgi:hypothetical protein
LHIFLIKKYFSVISSVFDKTQQEKKSKNLKTEHYYTKRRQKFGFTYSNSNSNHQIRIKLTAKKGNLFYWVIQATVFLLAQD